MEIDNILLRLESFTPGILVLNLESQKTLIPLLQFLPSWIKYCPFLLHAWRFNTIFPIGST